MEDIDVTGTVVDIASAAADTDDEEALFDGFAQQRADLQPFGRVKVFEVEGYEHLLGVEYKYIGSEVTEIIAKRIQKETRPHGGAGTTLLGSMDTLIEACSQIMVRSTPDEEWRPMGKEQPIKFDQLLCTRLKFTAKEPREIVLGLFGSEHSIIQQNIAVSRWLTVVTREGDEDFLG